MHEAARLGWRIGMQDEYLKESEWVQASIFQHKAYGFGMLNLEELDNDTIVSTWTRNCGWLAAPNALAGK